MGGHGTESDRCGLEVSRTHLLAGIERSGESLVLILAPAGYGKSVLAAQVSSAAPASLSLSCSCTEPTLGCLSTLLLSNIRRGAMHESPQILLPRPEEQNIALDLTDALASLPDRSTCVVLDDVAFSVDAAVVRELAHAVRAAMPMGRLVVTSRSQSLGDEMCDEALVVGARELRMRSDETRSLLEIATGQDVSDHMAERAQLLSQGHAAALRLIARSMCLGSTGDLEALSAEANLHVYLRRLAVQQLNPIHLELLYVLALLTSGNSNELKPLIGSAVRRELDRVSLCIPFVSLVRDDYRTTFQVHDLASAAYTDPDFVRDQVARAPELLRSVLALLDARGEYERLFKLLLRSSEDEQLLTWAEARGQGLLEKGSLTVLREVISRIGPKRVLRSSKLLLLEASLLREIPRYGEALRKAQVARNLALHDDNADMMLSCYLTIARLQMDLGWMADASVSLEQARDASGGGCSAETLALIDSYLALCYTCVGRVREAAHAAESAASMIANKDVAHEVLGRVTTCVGAATGVLSGRWDTALDLYLRIEGLEDASSSLRTQNTGNLGTVLCELGHLRRAEQMLESALPELNSREIDGFRHTFATSLAAVKAGLGQYRIAKELMEAAVSGLETDGDNMSLAHSLVFEATWQRAAGELGDSLATAERVLEMCSSLACQWLDWQAQLEVAATLLALGDGAAAQQAARALRLEVHEVGAERHWLTADMILAEVARREGRAEEGVARLLEHEEYILTDSANWQIAMYIRAFPHLLGMLAVALGAEKLPVYLLRMILPQDAERTLAASADLLDDDAWRELARRIVGESDATQLERMRETPRCYVRFFGGLEVRVGDREVLDKHWRKRKARLMFAMLTARQGSEMPREQIFEELWPEMDEPRARNNFYVIWGAMKAALVPMATKSTPCPYAENTGGMCRVVRGLVTSDLEEFELALADAADAERQDSAARAIRAYEQLADIYRGELLPGDIYEDWFSHTRDSCRVEFGDAMVRAAALLEREGDRVRALLMVRRGLRADPSREDLYQAALALQIAAGQRSAAIETYTSCRKRLADELGLDPSSETLRLYEQVLAMEDSAASDWASAEDGDAEAEDAESEEPNASE